jgi:hypothetical protein
LQNGHDPLPGEGLIFPDDHAQRLGLAHSRTLPAPTGRVASIGLTHPTRELAPGRLAS